MNINPTAGYLLAKPYIFKSTFQSVKETDGLDQKSVILEVGDEVEDNNGIARKSPCKKGDVVIHAYSNKEFEVEFTKYRFIHFSEVHGILNIKDKKDES